MTTFRNLDRSHIGRRTGADGVVAVWLACAVLTGCGGKDSAPPAKPAATAPVAQGPAAEATAAQVAAKARGALTCPPKIASPARAAAAPVDDVVGVRPGLTYEEAAAAVMCVHDLLVVQPETQRNMKMNTYGQSLRQGFTARFAEPKVNKSGKQIMKELQEQSLARSNNAIVRDMKPGQQKWFVATMGLPGQERVVSLAREEWFEEGRMPTVAAVEQALRGKYGTPSRIVQGGGTRHLTWIRDPRGTLLSEAALVGPLAYCRAAASPDSPTNFSAACGIVVDAAIVSLRSNPELSESMQAGVVDSGGGYQLITATESALQKLDAQRKAAEVEKASKNAVAPKI